MVRATSSSQAFWQDNAAIPMQIKDQQAYLMGLLRLPTAGQGRSEKPLGHKQNPPDQPALRGGAANHTRRLASELSKVAHLACAWRSRGWERVPRARKPARRRNRRQSKG